MKNEETNQNLEKLLKDKMDELASSVDCFDKISSKAFPETDTDFSDEGVTVSDLENVTGRSRNISVLKWIAGISAVVAGIMFIPKSSLMDNFLANVGENTGQKLYTQLVEEIFEETKNSDYTVIDVPLEYYISNDVLVTPLLSCPFEKSGRADMNARIFIRNIAGYNTNQVYAVEYSGTFSEENIFAVAETEVKFTAEDVEALENIQYYHQENDLVSQADISAFFFSDEGIIFDDERNPVCISSFEENTFYKDSEGICSLSCAVVYGHKNVKYEKEYFYDILTMTGSEEKICNRNGLWKTSVYHNGRSAFPDSSDSQFTRKDIFKNSLEYVSEEESFAYVQPFSEYDGESVPCKNIETKYSNDYAVTAVASNIYPPANPESFKNMRIYLPTYNFESISFGNSTDQYSRNVLKITFGDYSQNISYDQIVFSKSFYIRKSEEISQNINNISEIIRNNEEEMNNCESAERLRELQEFNDSLNESKNNLIAENDKILQMISS